MPPIDSSLNMPALRSTDEVKHGSSRATPESFSDVTAPAGHRRGWLKRTFQIGGAAAVVLLAGERIWRYQVETRHEGIWGTISSPKFTILSPQAPAEKILTYSEHVRDASNRAALATSRYQLDLNTIKAVRDDLATPQVTALTIESARATLTRLESEYKTSSVQDLQTQQQNRQQRLTAKYGSPLAYAVKLFEQVTGKPLPSELSLTAVSLNKGYSWGVADSLHEKVLVDEKTFVSSLQTGLHELGHMICLQNEHARFSSLVPLVSVDQKALTRDEACAELFRLAAAALIDDSELRALVGRLDLDPIEKFLSGDRSDVRHGEGYTIAAAAIELYGSPAEAFKHVASSSPLDPKIYSIIDRYGDEYRQTGGISPSSATLDLYTKIQSELEMLRQDLSRK